MTSVAVFFGALNLELPKQNRSFGRLSSLLLSDVLLIIGVGVLLLLVLAGIVYFWMKGRGKRRRHVSGGERVYKGSHRSEAGDESPSESSRALDRSGGDSNDAVDDEDGDGHASKRRYKYRVRRRSHRSRNPTLSETGGLPPAKSQESGKPF